jgi:DNA (cytosine-5)-methyltransferase 1
MTHGSLYSGIGGWLLAAKWAGIENIFTVEIDEYCNKVLDKHFPDTDRHHDIKEFKGEKYRGTVDILSTSDPCQPFSFAGKRGGKADDRYLWPQTIRAIREIKPSYVVFENVPGLLDLGNGKTFEGICSDLEGEGYTIEPFIIPACSVGTSHNRSRMWIIAYVRSITDYKQAAISLDGTKVYKESKYRVNVWGEYNRDYEFVSKSESYAAIDSVFCRENDGIPNRMDRTKSLGNAIIPQIAYIIFEAIKQYDIHS